MKFDGYTNGGSKERQHGLLSTGDLGSFRNGLLFVDGREDDMSGETGGYRLLHTMIRVTDLDRSIAFYVDMLGMKVLRRRDVPEGKYTLAFVGYGDEASSAVIEQIGRAHV